MSRHVDDLRDIAWCCIMSAARLRGMGEDHQARLLDKAGQATKRIAEEMDRAESWPEACRQVFLHKFHAETGGES